MNYFDKCVKYDPVNNYYIFQLEELKEIKNNLSKENLNQLEKEFEDLFLIEKMSVTSKKPQFSKDNSHDYVSLATYWWASDTETGLPYHNKDGYANPEGAEYDKDKLRLLAYLTYYGSLLFYLTEDQKYYQLVKEHCTYWFLSKDTAMNPNMNHAQYIPGINEGRGKGIIDFAANFSYALHMFTLLKRVGMLEDSFYQDMHKWMNKFRDWSLHSQHGIDESLERNNHGTMYDFMILVLDLFLEDHRGVTGYVRDFIRFRVNPQISEDGQLPLELARTKSKSYSLMAAKAFNDYFKLLEEKQFEVKNSLINAMNDWLIDTLVLERKPWNHQQVTIFDKACLVPLILEYQRKYNKQVNYHISFDDLVFKVPFYLFQL